MTATVTLPQVQGHSRGYEYPCSSWLSYVSNPASQMNKSDHYPSTKGLGGHQVWMVRQIWYFTDTEGAIGGAIGIGEAAEQELQRFIEQPPMVMFWLWK